MRNGMIQDSDGSRRWYKNGQLHRLDGPAIEHADGWRTWYQHGWLHREDGPAVERENGTREWILNGKIYTEEEYEHEMRLRKWGLAVDA